MRIALFQPDMPGNVGTILRLGACLATHVDIIEPCGFAYSDRALKRAGLDYAFATQIVRHEDWNAFLRARTGRLVLLTTLGATPLPKMRFRPDDILLLGSEGAGAPAAVHAAADERVRIPLAAGMRSLNVAVAAGIALGHALTDTGGWPA